MEFIMDISTPDRVGHPQPVSILSPFLKWAGAKTRCMSVLLSHLPSPHKVDCLIEPFGGSASVFLNTRYRQYVLADSNADLVDTWQHARDNPEELTEALHRLFDGGNSEMAWQRNRLAFNALPPGPEKSALFIYLNRHGFNGLCRYNRRGLFNVPFGRPAKPYLPAREIRTFARRASRCHVSFFHADFEETLQAATRGMFAGLRCALYCDPPYLALSNSASFTAYDGTAFTTDHHRALAARLQDIHRRTGFPVVVSASDTPASRQIYRGFTLTRLSVNRSVSASGTGRKAAGELIACLT